MTEPRTILFAGPLADKFGEEPIRLVCDDWLTLLDGLECIFPDFRVELSKYDDLAIAKAYGETVDYTAEHELGVTFGKADTIILAASEAGSAMAAATWVFQALATYGTTAATIAAVATYVAVTVAIAYATSAVMKALSDTPNAGDHKERDKHASFLFNGAQNVVEQGGAIPLIYGRHRVGGTIISSELSTEQMSKILADSYTVTAGETLNANVLSNDIGRQWLTVTGWTRDGTSMAVNATYTKAETPGTFDPETGTTGPSYQDGYTIQLQADGDLVVTSQRAASANHSLTYTVQDGRDGNTMSTTVSLKIRPQNIWGWNTDGGGDGTSEGTPGSADGSVGDSGDSGGVSI